MKKIIVTEQDKWIMTLTDDEYEKLVKGDIDITELLENKRTTNDLCWKNGFTDWEG